uniref:Uncharacterized protein n=1 Tax=Eutreptiella gymnastica TaxID=73025 RepID=A0A7S4FW82_9EUGL
MYNPKATCVHCLQAAKQCTQPREKRQNCRHERTRPSCGQVAHKGRATGQSYLKKPKPVQGRRGEGCKLCQTFSVRVAWLITGAGQHPDYVIFIVPPNPELLLHFCPLAFLSYLTVNYTPHCHPHPRRQFSRSGSMAPAQDGDQGASLFG